MGGRRTPQDHAAQICARITGLTPTGKRLLIAIAGPPASGKSTVAAAVVASLNATQDRARLLPMDGFHLDNSLLDARGLRARKGSPETFDLAGFASLMERLQVEDTLYGPSFDRARDVSVGSSIHVPVTAEVIVVEGNYLLLDQPGWRDLARHWDFSVFVDESLPTLRERLIRRWLRHRYSRQDATAKVAANDLPNAETILTHRLSADLTLGPND